MTKREGSLYIFSCLFIKGDKIMKTVILAEDQIKLVHI